MKSLSCVLALSLWLIAAGAQAVELAEMQAMALKNREVVRQYMTRLEQSEKDIQRARGGYYPSVDLGYTANLLDEENFTEAERNSVVSGRVSYNIFAGFSDRYGQLSAEMQRLVAEYRLAGIRQDVQLQVALAYLEVFERRANRQVAEAAFQTLERVFRDGENRYEVGLIGMNELLKFRVDFDNADITLQAAEAGLEKSINNLSRQVGTRIGLADLDFREFEVMPRLAEYTGMGERMLDRRSEIKALESLLAATKAGSEAGKSGYYPRVDVAGSYRRYDDELLNGAGGEDEDELRAQLVLSLNLFQGYTTEASLARARLEERAVGYELEELKQTLLTDLDNLTIDLRVGLENADVAARSIEQAQENLRITQLKYDEGLQRESDLLDAITSLSRARYNEVTVVRTVFLNKYLLIRMVDGFPVG